MAAKVTSVAPSATPSRTGISVNRRRRIDRRRRVDWVFFNHYRRRYNDRPPDHVSLGDDGIRFLDDGWRRAPIFVVRTFAVARLYGQICCQRRSGKSEYTYCT
jgi:hypothetical protein